MNRSGRTHLALWFVVLLAVGAAIAWAMRPVPVPVKMTRVTRGVLTSTVSAEGRTRVKDLYVIAAPVDGRLERITVNPGDMLEVDDVVLAIQPAASRPLDPRSRAEANAAVVAAKAAAAAGTTLIEVGDVTRLEVAADLLSSDAAVVREGARATVTGWGGPQSLAARVRRIDPAAFTKITALGLEEQRVRAVLDLVEPPPLGLGHDYRVDVAVVVWEGQNVLRVPSTSLFRVGDRWSVFRVSASRAHQIPVEIGPADGTWTIVTRGLNDADVVITQPSDVIEDGTRVSQH